MKIEITSAKNNYQTATIDGKNYEFEFSETELSESIYEDLFIQEIVAIIGEDSEFLTTKEMCDIIASEWDYDHVKSLIEYFIQENPNNLIDHLINK